MTKTLRYWQDLIKKSFKIWYLNKILQELNKILILISILQDSYKILQDLNKISTWVLADTANPEGFNSKSTTTMYSFNIVLLMQYSTCEIQVHGVFMNSKYWYLYLCSKVKIWCDFIWCTPFPIRLMQMLLHTKHWVRALFLTTYLSQLK